MERTTQTLERLYPSLRISAESDIFKHEPDDYVTRLDVDILVQEYPDPEGVEEEPVDTVAGKMIAYAVNYYEAIDNGQSVFDVLDAHSQDVAEFLELFSDDEFSAAVHKAVPDLIGSDLLIVDRVTIDERFRGIGLGLVAVQELIRAWGRDGLIALKPFPLQFSGFEDRAWVPPAELANSSRADIRRAAKEATDKLCRYWKRLGAVRVSRTSLYALNTAYRMPSVDDMLGRKPKADPPPDLSDMTPASRKPQ